MRRKRLGIIPLMGFAVATLAGATADAQQVEPYPGTLYFGSGLVTIPTAWISPRSGDVWVTSSAKDLPSFPDASASNVGTKLNTNISIESHWAGRFTVGGSAYSQNPEWGLFGQALLLRQDPASSWMPSVAVGVRNVGPYSHEDRFFIGEDITLGPDSTYHHAVGDRYQKFHTAGSFYGVATKDFLLNNGNSDFGVTAGWGTGLFRDNGGLGKSYNRTGQVVPGLFFGARYSFHPSLNTTVQLLAENDGWDYNAGIVGDWRGLTAGIYGSELEEGGGRSASSYYVYNYRKLNFQLAYNGNIFDIANGLILRSRITELTREQDRLRFEIAVRNQRISRLQVALGKAQNADYASLQDRREALQKEVQAERDAVQRAEDRLRQLENGGTVPPPVTPPSGSTTPPATTPPPTTPPATSPSTTPPSGGTTTPPSV